MRDTGYEMPDTGCQMRRGVSAAVVLTLILSAAGPAQGETVYETEGFSGYAIGAFDENIMADDVHIDAAATVTNIQLALAISGEQNCRVWLFDDVKSEALWSQPFTNVSAAHKADVTVYSFDLYVRVPRDFYVGFSAQGDGFNEFNTDWAQTATDVVVGTASNYNIFFYGAVAGGQLTTPFAPPENCGYLDIRVQAGPAAPVITSVACSNDTARLTIENLLPGKTNEVQRSAGAPFNDWTRAGRFVAGAMQTNWSGALTGEWDRTFYRVVEE